MTSAPSVRRPGTDRAGGATGVAAGPRPVRTDPAVEVAGVGHRWGAVVALDDVDLTVAAGSVHGVLGPNGAGKTTLLRALLGLLRPDTGRVRVLGRDPAAGGVRDGVAGFVDAPRFWPYLTVGATLAALAALDGGDAAARVGPALEAVGLGALTRRKAGTLSTGQRQRLALAGALLRDPHLLVVDEPTTGLDPRGIADLHDLVRDLAAAGRTVVLSSHDMTEVDRLCDHVTVLARGRVVHAGPLPELRARAVVASHRLRTSDAERAAPVLAAAAALDVAPGSAGEVTVTGPAAAVDDLVLRLAAAGVAVRELVAARTALEVEFARLVGDAP